MTWVELALETIRVTAIGSFYAGLAGLIFSFFYHFTDVMVLFREPQGFGYPVATPYGEAKR